GQQSKPRVLHLVQVKDTLQADDRGKNAGQKPPFEQTVVVAEALAGRGEPRLYLGPQQERPRILGMGKKNLSGTTGTKPPGARTSSTWAVTRFSSSWQAVWRDSSREAR